MSGHDFATVRTAAAESVIGGVVRWAVVRLGAAFADSWFRHRSLSAARALASWPLEDRVRYGALTIAVAGAVNIALLAFAGSYSAPGVPRALIGLVILLAVLVGLMPNTFVAAWPSSGLQRAASSLAGFFQNREE